MHTSIHHFVPKWISGDSVHMHLTTGYTRVRLCKIAQLILASWEPLHSEKQKHTRRMASKETPP